MTKKCGKCDFTNIEVSLCPQCKEVQCEIVQDVLKSGEAYKKLFNKNRKSDGGNL